MKTLCITAVITVKVLFWGEGSRNLLSTKNNQFIPFSCWCCRKRPAV